MKKNTLIKFATLTYVACTLVAFIMTCYYMKTVTYNTPQIQTYAAFMG